MTPTENPTCKHCGQGKSEHRPANYNDGVTIGQFLVCPFATFEAETETNLSGGVEGNAHSLRDHVSENHWGSSGKETGNPMPSENQASPAQNLSPAQEKLCEEWMSKFRCTNIVTHYARLPTRSTRLARTCAGSGVTTEATRRTT